MKAAATSILWLLLAAVSVQAAQNTELLTPTQRADAWAKALRGIDAQLRKAEFASARQSAIDLAEDMVRQIGAGGSSAYTLAVACAFRAIAEQGLGKGDDALWYWRTAEAIFPAIDRSDLSPYGAAAAHLKEIPFRAQFDASKPRVLAELTDAKPPVLKKRIEPQYPPKMGEMGITKQYVFEMIIDERGAFREPKVLAPVKEPSFVYIVLDALRKWEFEPSTLDGKPIAVIYSLTVDFKMRR